MKPRDLSLGPWSLLGIVVGTFSSGLIASGAFWTAVALVLQTYSNFPLPFAALILFGISGSISCLIFVASYLSRHRLSMKYTIFPFIVGGLLSALVGFLLIGIWAWASSVAATGG